MGTEQYTSVSRRSFMRVGGLAATGALAAACAPATAPAPAAPAPSTGGNAAPAAPAGKPAWQEEYDKLVAAARGEGKLNILTIAGTGYRKWIAAFEESFGVTAEHQQVPSIGPLMPRILEERKSGIYSQDMLVGGTGSIAPLRDTGALEPLRPVIILPDILDDKTWLGGFDTGWGDIGKKFIYNAGETLSMALVNTELAREDEFRSVQDLLNPKWKGKFIFIDPSTSNFTALPMVAIAKRQGGTDIVKRIFTEQQPAIHRENRFIAESIVRGRHVLGTGVTRPVLDQFKADGLAKSVKYVDIPDFTTASSAEGLFFLTRAPHPNAAKLFINWTLSKAGQEAYSKTIGNNSRRTDVAPVDPDQIQKPGRFYFQSNETTFPEIQEMRTLLSSLVR